MKFKLNGIELDLATTPDLFSPSAPDKGTLAMLNAVEIIPSDKVLDLGCGCGIAGIYAAKITGAHNVTMTDILPIAAETAKQNAIKNNVPDITVLCGSAYENVNDTDYTLILSNPPYHTDFSVAKSFIEGAYRHLAVGGRMVMVTKRLDWYKNKLTSVFGGVKVTEADGYYVFISEKRPRPRKPAKPKNTLSKKLSRKLKQHRTKTDKGFVRCCLKSQK